MKPVDPQILARVQRGKLSAERLKTATHTMGTRKEPRRKLLSSEVKNNHHNAKAERSYCAGLLRAGRRGHDVFRAHWAAIGA